MEIPFLQDIVIIFGLAVAVLLICYRLRIPTIAGFLLTGIICGPHGLGMVEGVAEVETLAKVGIMLLLFTIGLEFSLKRLLEIKRYFLIGGSLQVGLTVLAGFIIAKLLHRPFGEAIFLGFLLSMSSTAIVLKGLEKQDSTDSPQGRLSLGVLIFQDIIAVPMILLIPMLSESHDAFDIAYITRLIIGVVTIVIVFVGAIKIVPRLLYYIAKVRSRELFSLTVLTICFAVAWLASSAGLSLAIGAFLAGLIISESEYRHEAVGNILPLQDLFSSLFFVSTGMILDLSFVLHQPITILLITVAVMLMKGGIVAFTTFALGLPLRAMILSGIALSQIGEFSFVLAKSGIDLGLGNEYYYQLFLAVALLTMAITPSMIDESHRILKFLLRFPLPSSWKSGLSATDPENHEKLKDHIVIIGFGIAGRHLALAAKQTGIPYIITEMNPETVRKEQLKGEPIHFGDATHPVVLSLLNIEEAKAIAVMINDSHAARQIVGLIHHLNPKAYLIVRSRYIQDMKTFYQLGASDVIPDEFGTSIEMFTRVLEQYEISEDKLEGLVNSLRTDEFKKLRHV